MSRSEKQDRRVAPPLGVDPWFSVVVPDGSVDPTGFSESDGAGSRLPDSYGEDVGPVSGGYLGEAGANSTTAGLGMDATKGEWLGGQHALSPAPLEYSDGGTAEHAEPGSPEARARRFGLSDPGAKL
jgi:hypothetical protein